MTKPIHKNFIRSSNLIFITLVLSVIYLFLPNIHIMAGMMPIVIGTFLFIITLGVLVRKGFSWVKYLLLVLALWGLISLQSPLQNIPELSIADFISIAPVVLQIWATILLFRIPKETSQESR